MNRTLCPSARGLTQLGLSLALCVLLPACNFLIDTSTEQCEVDADCQGGERAGLGLVCTSERVCGREACQAHSDCSDRYDGDGFCRADGVCARLFTDQCRSLRFRGDDASDLRRIPDDRELVVVGFMGPAPPDPDADVLDWDGAYGVPLREGAVRAIRLIDQVYPTSDEGKSETLALLDCDDNREGAALGCVNVDEPPPSVYRHLADEVQVPAIIGPVFSSTTDCLLRKALSGGDGPLVLSPSATAINLSGRDELFWRTVPPDTYQVAALIRLYRRVLELQGRDEAALSPQELAVVSCTTNVWCESFSGELLTSLRDQEVLHRTHEYDRSRPIAEVKDALDDIVKQLLIDRPRIIFGIGIGELGEHLVRELELNPDAHGGGGVPYRPVYLFPEAERHPDLARTVVEASEAGIALHTRILGTAPGPRAAASGENDISYFLQLYNDDSPGNLAEFAFDAAYLIAYAIAGSRIQHPSGVELSRQLGELSCRGGYDLRAKWQEYVQRATRLAEGAESCVDYVGVSGPLDFGADNGDPDSREAASDIGFWCPVLSGGEVEFRAPPGTLGDTRPPYWKVTSAPASLENTDKLTFCGDEKDQTPDDGADAGIGD